MVPFSKLQQRPLQRRRRKESLQKILHLSTFCKQGESCYCKFVSLLHSCFLPVFLLQTISIISIISSSFQLDFLPTFFFFALLLSKFKDSLISDSASLASSSPYSLRYAQPANGLMFSSKGSSLFHAILLVTFNAHTL